MVRTKFQGRTTAGGERFDMNQMTCAHRSLPLGTWLRVTNLEDHRTAYVRVNDRGPVLEKPESWAPVVCGGAGAGTRRRRHRPGEAGAGQQRRSRDGPGSGGTVATACGVAACTLRTRNDRKKKSGGGVKFVLFRYKYNLMAELGRIGGDSSGGFALDCFDGQGDDPSTCTQGSCRGTQARA